MSDVHSSSKLIDDNMLVKAISVPEFGTRIFRVSIQPRFLPRPSTFTKSRTTPVDKNGTFNSSWLCKVRTDSLEVAKISNKYIAGDVFEITTSCTIKDTRPVLGISSFKWTSTVFESVYSNSLNVINSKSYTFAK